MGSDDSIMAEFTDPPLTTVRQPASALAQQATRLLVEQLAGAPAPETETLVPPELTVRVSSARAPAG